MSIHNSVTRFAYLRDEKNMIVVPAELLYVFGGDLMAAHGLNRVIWWSAWAYKQGREGGEFWKTDTEWRQDVLIGRRKIHEAINLANDKAKELFIKKYPDAAPGRPMIATRTGKEVMQDGSFMNSLTTYYTVDPDMWQVFFDWCTEQQANGGEMIKVRKPRESNNDNDASGESSSIQNRQNSQFGNDKIDDSETTNLSFLNNTESTAEKTAERTQNRDSNESQPVAVIENPDDSLTGLNGLVPERKTRRGSTRVERDDPRIWAMVTRYFGARGLSASRATQKERNQVYNVFNGLPRDTSWDDIEGCTRYLHSQQWYQEPGRLTADAVANTMQDWIYKGRPETVAPKMDGANAFAAGMDFAAEEMG